MIYTTGALTLITSKEGITLRDLDGNEIIITNSDYSVIVHMLAPDYFDRLQRIERELLKDWAPAAHVVHREPVKRGRPIKDKTDGPLFDIEGDMPEEWR